MELLHLPTTYRREHGEICGVVLPILLGEIADERIKRAPDGRFIGKGGIAATYIPASSAKASAGHGWELEEVANKQDGEPAEGRVATAYLATDCIDCLKDACREHRDFVDNEHLRLGDAARKMFAARDAVNIGARE